MKTKTLLRLFLLLLLTVSLSTANAQQWRVTKMSRHFKDETATNPAYIPTYAEAYKYNSNANRGSNKDHKEINYDELIQSTIDVFGVLKPETKSILTYNNDNSVATELLTFINGGTVLRTDSFYYTNGRLTKHMRHLQTKSIQIEYQYNTQGDMSVMTTSIRNGSSMFYIDDNRHDYMYDNQNRLILDSTSDFSGGVWAFLEKENTVYNATGSIKETIVSAPSRTVYKKFYTYDAANVLIADSTQNYVGTANALKDYINYTYTYNTKGQLESSKRRRKENVGAKLIGKKDVSIIYTTFDYVKEIYYEDYHTQTGVHAQTTKDLYDFEMYWPVSVNAISSPNDKLLVYPNPTINTLNVAFENAQPSNVTGQVINALGQTVRVWTDKIESNYSKQVDVADLPAGNYHLRLSIGTEVMNRSFVLVR